MNILLVESLNPQSKSVFISLIPSLENMLIKIGLDPHKHIIWIL